MIEEDILEFLVQGLPEPLEHEVDIVIGIPVLVASVCMLAYQRSASSEPGIIRVHPNYYDPETASGLALIGHELYHQWQFEEIPELLDLYVVEEARVAANNLPPYANKYEWPAYAYEVDIYRAALAKGYPPGKHRPLLIDDGVFPGLHINGIEHFSIYLGVATFVLNFLGLIVKNRKA